MMGGRNYIAGALGDAGDDLHLIGAGDLVGIGFKEFVKRGAGHELGRPILRRLGVKIAEKGDVYRYGLHHLAAHYQVRLRRHRIGGGILIAALDIELELAAHAPETF